MISANAANMARAFMAAEMVMAAANYGRSFMARARAEKVLDHFFCSRRRGCPPDRAQLP